MHNYVETVNSIVTKVMQICPLDPWLEAYL